MTTQKTGGFSIGSEIAGSEQAMDIERKSTETKWEYCTMVATQTTENRMLYVSVLREVGGPEGRKLGTAQLGAAIAQLGAEGWEMCGFYTINLADGLGQQFYFKRPL
jgi:hypothetical protein